MHNVLVSNCTNIFNGIGIFKKYIFVFTNRFYEFNMNTIIIPKVFI